MSFSDRLLLALHLAFVIFAVGPVTIATLATPRYIRLRNVTVLRYLLRMTRIFTAASLGVAVFGAVLGQSLNKLGTVWLTVSMTLFVVALVLLVLIMRDQRRAIVALETAPAPAPAAAAPATQPEDERPGDSAGAAAGTGAGGTPGPAAPAGHGEPSPAHVATVERGRIASMSGIVSLIWLAILVLMVWNT
jgi:hypothetical protein